ncbi:MAG: SDR family NAD(P)-dependent oxidoreductase, partial [Gammaproteobacteria bacterium]|nr:SDR family NAD(P)-dependent oxidoreductase [Gammaproteobacteria bacterium]
MNNFNPSNYSPASDLLTDRVILISGAGAGIGRAVARAFAAHGASVVLTSRTLKNLQTLQDEIVADGYPRPVIVPMDLA